MWEASRCGSEAFHTSVCRTMAITNLNVTNSIEIDLYYFITELSAMIYYIHSSGILFWKCKNCNWNFIVFLHSLFTQISIQTFHDTNIFLFCFVKSSFRVKKNQYFGTFQDFTTFNSISTISNTTSK